MREDNSFQGERGENDLFSTCMAGKQEVVVISCREKDLGEKAR